MGPIWNTSPLHELNTSHAWQIYESNPEQLLVLKAPQVGSTSQVNKSGEQWGPQFGSMIQVHESGSNTSHALLVNESNPEQLLVFKALRVGSTSRVNKLCERVGSTILGLHQIHKSNLEQFLVFKSPRVDAPQGTVPEGRSMQIKYNEKGHQTNRQTLQQLDWPGPEGPVGEEIFFRDHHCLKSLLKHSESYNVWLFCQKVKLNILWKWPVLTSRQPIGQLYRNLVPIFASQSSEKARNVWQEIEQYKI